MRVAPVSLLVSLSLTLGVAAAQNGFPGKPITFIVPTTAGGALDITGRTVAEEMSKMLGQPIIIENKPSAGFVLGYEYVAKQAPADGYTAVLAVVDSLAALPLTYKNLRFDPLRDLPPLIDLVETRNIFGSAASNPWTTLNEMVAYVKANPGKLNYGGSGMDVQLQTELLLQGLGISVTFVPYKGGTEFLRALLSNEVQMGLIGETRGHEWGDKFRVLAITGRSRLESFPNVPTFAELGYPQMRSVVFSMNLRAGTPRPVVDRLYAAASAALEQPAAKARFEKIWYRTVGGTSQAAAENLADGGRILAETAKKVGIRPQ